MGSKSRARDGRVLTSGQVARLVGVSARSVTKWVDAGRLPGYRLPGSMDRRVLRDEVVAFCRREGVPLHPSLSAGRLIVLAGVGEPFAASFAAAAVVAGWEVRRRGVLAEATVEAMADRAAAAVFDHALGSAACREAAAALRPRLPELVTAGLLADDSPGRGGYSLAYRAGAPGASVAADVLRLLEPPGPRRFRGRGAAAAAERGAA